MEYWCQGCQDLTSFATAGVYTVSVTVTDNKGATNAASTKITVKDVTPVATTVTLQLAPTTIGLNEKLALAAVVKDQNGTVMSGQGIRDLLQQWCGPCQQQRFSSSR